MSQFTVAETILQQLGGKRFCLMTGVKNGGLLADKDALHIEIGENAKGVETVIIKLNSWDYYDLRFLRFNEKTAELEELAFDENVDVENLTDTFTEHTGLYTSL